MKLTAPNDIKLRSPRGPADHTETIATRQSGASSGPVQVQKPGTRSFEDSALRDDPNRYELTREYARGGLGRILEAQDSRLGRTVAVKELLKRTTDSEVRFIREALITARLQHPSIVPVHEAGRWPSGEPYYVMKLISGMSLKELIASKHDLDQRMSLLPNVIAMAEAMAYAHSQGVIHRDIKPSNVVVGEFGETMVVDWGLAKDLRGDNEPETASLANSPEVESGATADVVGTPAYMPPEQARGDDCERTGGCVCPGLSALPPDHWQGTIQRRHLR